MRIVLAIAGVLLALTGCSVHGDREFAARYVGNSDMIACWESAGVDDPGLLLARAGAGRSGDLRRVLELTVTAELDGAATEGHASVLGSLLHHVGDRSFSSALEPVSAIVRSEVASRLSYALADEGADVRYEDWFATEYPLTWGALGGERVSESAKARAIELVRKATSLEGVKVEDNSWGNRSSEFIESIAKVLEWKYTLELSRVLVEVREGDHPGARNMSELLVLLLDQVGDEVFANSIGMQGSSSSSAVACWWKELSPARRSDIEANAPRTYKQVLSAIDE